MDRKINAILVDDEPGCLSNLQYYLGKFCPRIGIIDTAPDADSATALLRNKSVDLAFMDVQLFDRTSFEIIPVCDEYSCPIVFVTAYEKFALNAFRVSALDYILKPLEKEEIIRCYQKILRRFDALSQEPPVQKPKSARIILRQGDHVYPTTVDKVVYLMAQGFYTTVCFEQEGKLREIMLSKPINMLQQEWDWPQLMRVHRSFVINLQRIKEIRKTGSNVSLRLGDRVIPVAKRRTTEFLEQCYA